ncbi:MAG: hypothetical protein R3B09_13230 [Nannocystaceae bacterium]
MRFTTRTPADTTPEALVDRLFAADDDPSKAAALAALRGVNPGLVGASVEAGVGSLLLLPPADAGLPPLRSEVPSIARVAGLEVALLHRALDGVKAAADAAEAEAEAQLSPLQALLAAVQYSPNDAVYVATAEGLVGAADSRANAATRDADQLRALIGRLRDDLDRLVGEL